MSRTRIVSAILLLTACNESDVESLEALAREGAFAGAPTDAHGELVTRIWDMTDGTSKVTHHLVDEFARVDTEIVLAEGLELDRGAVVDAWGEFDAEGRLHVDSFEITQLALIDPVPRSPRRIATILVEWEGDGLGEIAGAAPNEMFTGPKSTNVFYAENSYGVETMSGDVFGPYTIADPGGCNPGQIQFSGLDALALAGEDRQDWQQFMFVFPTESCGFAGLANLGSPDMPAAYSWYNGTLGCAVRNQELGHNYGMGHSRGYTCSDETGIVPFSDTCSEEEYGDPWDPMGSEGSSGCYHMNAVQKTFMGWLDGCNVVTATDNATFNLLPLELPCDGPQAVKFPTFDGRYYWLEYRTGRGEFHETLDEGIIVRVAADTAGAPRPYFIDLGQGDFLFEGDSYTDPEGVVTFTAVSFNGTHAVVEATFADPSGDPPTCLDGSDPGMEDGNVGQRICAEEVYKGDSVPPEITVTFPEEGQWFEPGSDFDILADVTDDRVVVSVELYLDDAPLFRLTEPPWEWEVTNIPEGTYTIGAIARDSRHYTESNVITFNVGEEPSNEESGESSATDPGSTSEGLTEGATTDTDGGESDTESGDPGASSDDKGCGCSTGRTGAAPLFALVLLALRRRRRSAHMV
jgi:MYXO-CTERM domain-containing protein